MIPTLNLQKEDLKQKFDESMGMSGGWTSFTNDFDFVSIKELDYRSGTWKYYIAQRSDGEHFLLRNKQ